MRALLFGKSDESCRQNRGKKNTLFVVSKNEDKGKMSRIRRTTTMMMMIIKHHPHERGRGRQTRPHLCRHQREKTKVGKSPKIRFRFVRALDSHTHHHSFAVSNYKKLCFSPFSITHQHGTNSLCCVSISLNMNLM